MEEDDDGELRAVDLRRSDRVRVEWAKLSEIEVADDLLPPDANDEDVVDEKQDKAEDDGADMPGMASPVSWNAPSPSSLQGSKTSSATERPVASTASTAAAAAGAGRRTDSPNRFG